MHNAKLDSLFTMMVAGVFAFAPSVWSSVPADVSDDPNAKQQAQQSDQTRQQNEDPNDTLIPEDELVAEHNDAITPGNDMTADSTWRPRPIYPRPYFPGRIHPRPNYPHRPFGYWQCTAWDYGFEEHRGGHVVMGYDYYQVYQQVLNACSYYHGRCQVSCFRRY